MKALLQIATLLALAVDVASAVMLYWTTQSPGQDAAGRGMASGFLGLTIVAMAASALLLLLSYWRGSAWVAFSALLIAIGPLVLVIVPALL